MNENMFKIAGVLSDRTRYAVYDYVCNKFSGVSVQDVADEFAIHPNVARLHLTKLEDVALIRSEFDKKEKKGGRPNKIYMRSNDTISFHFPHRDFSVISGLALKTLADLGPYAWKAFITQSYQYGKEHGQKSRLQYQITANSPLNSITDSIRATLKSLGLNPTVEVINDNEILFNVRNCTFKDCTQLFPEVLCKAHQKVLQGIFEAFFENMHFKPVKTLQNFNCCNFCHYEVQLLNDQKHDTYLSKADLADEEHDKTNK